MKSSILWQVDIKGKLPVSVGNRQLLQPWGCSAHPNLSANSKKLNYFLITVKLRVCWTFLFCPTPWIFRFSRWNGVRIGRFCVRTACFFSQKPGFKSGSVILPCSVTFSQRLPKSSDLGRSIPCSIHADGRMTFKFQGGTEIEAWVPTKMKRPQVSTPAVYCCPHG